MESSFESVNLDRSLFTHIQRIMSSQMTNYLDHPTIPIRAMMHLVVKEVVVDMAW